MKIQALLINEEQLRQYTPISGTFDWAFISPHIITAQDLDIQPLLGYPMYQRLQNGIEANDLTPDEEILLNDFVLKALAWHTMAHAYHFLSSKLVKSTLTKIIVEEGDVVEQEEASKLASKSKATANFYAERLLNYLEANKDLFPYYNVKLDGELESSKDKTSHFGFNL